MLAKGELLILLPGLGITPFCLPCGTRPADSPLVTRSGRACGISLATSNEIGLPGGNSGLSSGVKGKGEGSGREAGSGKGAGPLLGYSLFASTTWRLVEVDGASFAPPFVPGMGPISCWGAAPTGLGTAAPTSSCPYTDNNLLRTTPAHPSRILAVRQTCMAESPLLRQC
jgi:hypothetical protein